MFRNTLAVIVGYVVMSIGVVASTALLAVVFPDYAAASESGAKPPTLPVALNLISALPCAMLGSVVTTLIARRSPRPAYVLAGIVFILGIGYAIIGLTNGGPQPAW